MNTNTNTNTYRIDSDNLRDQLLTEADELNRTRFFDEGYNAAVEADSQVAYGDDGERPGLLTSTNGADSWDANLLNGLDVSDAEKYLGVTLYDDDGLTSEAVEMLGRYNRECTTGWNEYVRSNVEADESTTESTTLGFQVLEDNGGGLHLAVFEGETYDDCSWFLTGFEHNVGSLTACMDALRSGDTPESWDGLEDDPQQRYDELINDEYGCKVVADDTDVYPSRCGAAACTEFGIEIDA